MAEKSELQDPGFWNWFECERNGRGMTYEEVRVKGGSIYEDQTGIWNAAHRKSDLTFQMIATIAQAFEMTRLAVLQKAGFISLMPEELHFANPELFELFTQASKLTISQQRDVTKMISGLIDNSDPLDHANPELISLFETARRVSPERQREFTQMISLFTENI